MIKLRKVIASLGVVAILSTLVVSTAVSAGTFGDVPASEWYAPHVEVLVDAGVLDTANANFRPADTLSRAEALKLAIVVCGNEGTTDISFPDVSANDWFYGYVQTGVANGIINGNADGTFAPLDAVNRAAFSKMVVNACDLPASSMTSPFSDVASGAWYHDSVITAYAWSIVDGYSDGTFRPDAKIQRSAAAKIAAVAMDPVERVAGATDDTTVDDTTDTTTSYSGDLVVSLNADSSVGATLPSGATSVKMASWDFTAKTGATLLKSLTIKRYGVATMPGTHQVYLYEGNSRLTSGKAVNSTTNEVNFGNLNYAISSGSTKTLTLRMDVGDNSSGVSGEVGFQIENAEAVVAGSDSVAGSFPVKGDKFIISTIAGGTVTVDVNGTLTNASVGEKGATVSKFKLSANSEKASVEEIGLYISGTVSTADVRNLKLYGAGKSDPIAEVDALNSKDVAQFMLDTPYDIQKGDTRTFYVTAEFNSGRTGDTVLAYIDESTDVVAVGDKYGYGMGVTMTAYDGGTCSVSVPTDCSAMTLQGGDITIAGSTIANRNIAVNQKDVEVLHFTITSEGETTFNNFGIQLTPSVAADLANADAGFLNNTSSGANFTDIKISEVGGDHVWGPFDSNTLKDAIAGDAIVEGTTGDAVTAYYLFTDDLVMEAGESREFSMTLDVGSDADLANETITAGIYIAGSYPELKDANNKILTNASSLVPTSTYSGDQFTIKAESLTLSRSSSVGSSTKVIGTQGVEMAAFSFAAGDASDLKITSLSLTGYVDSDAAVNTGVFVAGVETKYFNEMVLSTNIYKGSVSEANKISATSKSAVAATGVILFDNLNWVIPAGKSEVLIVTGNLANNDDYNNYAVKVDIAAATTDVVAENSDGNSIASSITGDATNGGVTDSASYSYVLISDGGTLALSVPSPIAQSQIIVGGSSAKEFGKLRLTATNESFKVDKLFIRNDYRTTAGDFDDNLGSVKVKYYTDLAQTVEETSSCAQSSASFYTCTGLNIMVPNPDLSGVPDYADVKILADITGIANAQADEGDTPRLSYALNDFEATGVSSGKKVTEATLTLTGVGTTSVNTTLDLTTTLTAAATSVVADAAVGNLLKPGDLFCIDVDDGASSCAALELIYVQSVSASTLTVVRGANGTTAAAYTAAGGDDSILVYSGQTALNTLTTLDVATTLIAADTTIVSDATVGANVVAGDYICVDVDDAGGICNALELMYVTNVNGSEITVVRGAKGTTAAGYTAAGGNDSIVKFLDTRSLQSNYMQVQATDLDVTATAASRSGSTATNEPVVSLSIKADSAKDAKLTQGKTVASLTAGTDGANADNAITATAVASVDGSSSRLAAATSFTDADTVYWIGGDMTGYTRASFWLQIDDVDDNGSTPDFTQMKIFTAADATVAGDNSATLVNPVTTPIDGSWYFFDVAIPGAGAALIAADVNFGLELTDVSTMTSAATGFTTGDFLYADQFVLYNEKINVDLTLNENWASFAPTLAYLKQNGSTVATGYVDLDGAVALRTGQVQFVPHTTYGDIVISGTDTFTVEMDTSSAITDDASATEKLTATVDLGNVTTNGDIFWNDYSDIIHFLGVSSTDKVSVTSSY